MMLLWTDSGCSTAVEQTPHDLEVTGSDPIGLLSSFAFFPFPSAKGPFIRSLKDVDLYG